MYSQPWTTARSCWPHLKRGCGSQVCEDEFIAQGICPTKAITVVSEARMVHKRDRPRKGCHAVANLILPLLCSHFRSQKSPTLVLVRHVQLMSHLVEEECVSDKQSFLREQVEEEHERVSLQRHVPLSSTPEKSGTNELAVNVYPGESLTLIVLIWSWVPRWTISRPGTDERPAAPNPRVEGAEDIHPVERTRRGSKWRAPKGTLLLPPYST
jgi:hypothetical protein